jgi:hypothetical protein
VTAPQYAKTVTDVPSKIVNAEEVFRPVWVYVVGNSTVYVGNSTVTTANGFPLVKHSAPIQGSLGPGQDLWAVTGSGVTEEIRIFTMPAD